MLSWILANYQMEICCRLFPFLQQWTGINAVSHLPVVCRLHKFSTCSTTSMNDIAWLLWISNRSILSELKVLLWHRSPFLRPKCLLGSGSLVLETPPAWYRHLSSTRCNLWQLSPPCSWWASFTFCLSPLIRKFFICLLLPCHLHVTLFPVIFLFSRGQPKIARERAVLPPTLCERPTDLYYERHEQRYWNNGGV